MEVKIKMSRRKIIIILMIVVAMLGCFIWYGELGTNKEVPKRAKYVGNFIWRGDYN